MPKFLHNSTRWLYWSLERLAWRLRGRPGFRNICRGRELYRSGQYGSAVAEMLTGLDEWNGNDAARLQFSRWVRYGLIPVSLAKDTLWNIANRAPPPLAQKAAKNIINLVWERNGAREAVVEMRKAESCLPRTPSFQLRMAALLHDAGESEDAVRILVRLARAAPSVLGQTGYLELIVLAQEAGLQRWLPQAAAAQSWTARLNEGEQRLNVYLKQSDKIAIVANGRSLLGNNLGSIIDSHAGVIRCNNFAKGPLAKDYGERTDVWIRPADSKHVPWLTPVNPPFILFTGANLRHSFSDGLQRLMSCPPLSSSVLAIAPPNLYLELFDALGASPSSGLLGLALLAERCGGAVTPSQVFAYSLHENTKRSSTYYDKLETGNRPSRHNWKAEENLFHKLVR